MLTVLGFTINVFGGALDSLRYGRALPAVGQPIMIDPKQIVGVVRDSRSIRCSRPDRRGISRVRGGDWDNDPRPIPLIVALYVDYFESSMEESDREILSERLKELAGRVPKKGVSKCDDLFASVSRHGFRWDIGDPRLRWLPLGLRRWIPDGLSGLQVAIARDGSYLMASGGAHRLALALHLKMTDVPAFVCLVHEEWVIASAHARRSRS